MNKFKEFLEKQEVRKEVSKAELTLTDGWWFDTWHHHLNIFQEYIDGEKEFFTEQHFFFLRNI